MVFLLGLITCLLPSCCLGLSHSTFSIPPPVQFPMAIAMRLSFQLPPLQQSKATQNPSTRYLSDCIMDITDYICMPLHWIVLSTANFRLQIFSGTNELFHSLCSSNFTFGATWLLRGRRNLFSWLLPRLIFFWKLCRSSSCKIFCVYFSISFPYFCIPLLFSH